MFKDNSFKKKKNVNTFIRFPWMLYRTKICRYGFQDTNWPNFNFCTNCYIWFCDMTGCRGEENTPYQSGLNPVFSNRFTPLLSDFWCEQKNQLLWGTNKNYGLYSAPQLEATNYLLTLCAGNSGSVEKVGVWWLGFSGQLVKCLVAGWMVCIFEDTNSGQMILPDGYVTGDDELNLQEFQLQLIFTLIL